MTLFLSIKMICIIHIVLLLHHNTLAQRPRDIFRRRHSIPRKKPTIEVVNVEAGNKAKDNLSASHEAPHSSRHGYEEDGFVQQKEVAFLDRDADQTHQDSKRTKNRMASHRRKEAYPILMMQNKNLEEIIKLHNSELKLLNKMESSILHIQKGLIEKG